MIAVIIFIIKGIAIYVGSRAVTKFRYGWRHSDSEAYLECMICLILFIGIGYTLTTCG